MPFMDTVLAGVVARFPDEFLTGGKGGKTVLRAGYGIFYDRFSQDLILQAQRLNGTTQQQFVVNQPDFYPNIPSPATLAADAMTGAARFAAGAGRGGSFAG